MQPAPIKWFKIYSALLCVIYLGVAAASLFFFLSEPKDLEMTETAAFVVGTLTLLMGAGLFGACLVPLIVEPQPWVWTYDLVIICLGLTSACFWPICIPLLIHWLKPATKAYFGK